MRVEEGRVVGCDDELDLTEDVKRASAGHAVHGCDYGLPAVARLRSYIPAGIVVHPGGGVAGVVAGRHGVGVGIGDGFVAVDAGAERFALGGQHHAPDVIVVPNFVPEVAQVVLHLLVDRVADLRTVERHPRDAVVLGEEQGLVTSHRASVGKPQRMFGSSRLVRKASWPLSMLSKVVPAATIVDTCMSASRRWVSCASHAARTVP